MKELKNLERLNIGNNRISDISPLRKMNKLNFLWAASNQVSDISVLKELPNLKEIYLNGNPISQDDIDELTEALPDAQIWH